MLMFKSGIFFQNNIYKHFIQNINIYWEHFFFTRLVNHDKSPPCTICFLISVDYNNLGIMSQIMGFCLYTNAVKNTYVLIMILS